MEASTYAWAVILTFFIFYGTLQLRKCFIQLSSSAQRNDSTNRASTSSVYTIENDNSARSFRNDQEMLRSNSTTNKKDDKDLPTYEEVIATDKQNPNNRFSSSISTVSGGTCSSNTLSDVTPANTINR